MPRDIQDVDFPRGRGLNVHIVIYVPSTRNVTEKISDSEFKARIRKTYNFLTKTFLGTTRVSGIGRWVDTEGKRIVQEKIVKVESFTTVRSYKKAQDAVRKWLHKKKRAWKQNSLSYEFEEELFFV